MKTVITVYNITKKRRKLELKVTVKKGDVNIARLIWETVCNKYDSFNYLVKKEIKL